MVSKLTILVGLVLLISISIWAYFNIEYQQKKLMEGIIEGPGKKVVRILQD